jgi:hypothetical protein
VSIKQFGVGLIISSRLGQVVDMRRIFDAVQFGVLMVVPGPGLAGSVDGFAAAIERGDLDLEITSDPGQLSARDGRAERA